MLVVLLFKAVGLGLAVTGEKPFDAGGYSACCPDDVGLLFGMTRPLIV